jgi:prepilin-type N-terminal cleavage/methylation domain-containing protein
MKRVPRPASQGFTFVEVLVALLAASLLVSAAASALITSLRAEQTAAHLRTGALLVQAVFARNCLDAGETNGVPDTDWAMTSDLFETRTETATNTWRVWVLFPNDRPSLSVTLALRDE